MSTQKRVGIHVHGRHLQALSAEEIMWGRPPDQLGQLTQAIKILIDHRPGEVVSFSIGTGASNKEGILEAVYWGKMLLDRIDQMKEFDVIRKRAFHISDVRQEIENILFLEMASQNTREEAQKVAEHGVAVGIEQLIVVSAPTHLSRIVVDVLRVLDSDPNFRTMRENVSFHASDVPYEGTTVGDVVVIEPPHRGDDTSPPLYKLLPQYFRIPADKKHSFFARFAELLKEFGS